MSDIRKFFEDLINNLNSPRKKSINEELLYELIDEESINELESDSQLLIDLFSPKISFKIKHKLFNLIFENARLLENFPEFLKWIESKFQVNIDYLKNGKLIKFYVPVYLPIEKKAKIIGASVFVLKDFIKGVDFTQCLKKSDLNIIATFCKKGFLFSSEECLSMNSYMLATTMAVNLEFFPKDFIFSGRITPQGKILSVIATQYKSQAAKETGKNFIFNNLFDDSLQSLIDFFSGNEEIVIPYYFSAKSVDSSYVDVINSLAHKCSCRLDFLISMYGNDIYSLLFKKISLPDRNEEDALVWIEEVKEIREDLKKLTAKFKEFFKRNFKKQPQISFTIAINGPLAFAFALGYYLKNNVKVSGIAQWDGGDYFIIPLSSFK